MKILHLFHVAGVVDTADIGLSRTLLEEVEVYQSQSCQIEIKFDRSAYYVTSGDEQLIKRMLRNALDNATSFAKSKVQISIEGEEGYWRVDIVDDGVGIDEDKIESFGAKALSRKVRRDGDRRISIGLGAYIMKKIAMAHAGRLEILNAFHDGRRAGANLRIWMPRA